MLKFAACIFLTGTSLNISCKKDLSCDSCIEINKPQISKAGPDQVITLPTDSVTLDGWTSNDPDGTISEWLWAKISGPASFTIVTIWFNNIHIAIRDLLTNTTSFDCLSEPKAELTAKEKITSLFSMAGEMQGSAPASFTINTKQPQQRS